MGGAGAGAEVPISSCTGAWCILKLGSTVCVFMGWNRRTSTEALVAPGTVPNRLAISVSQVILFSRNIGEKEKKQTLNKRKNR